ncbi:MAG: hypothetical protein ACRCU5_05760, partial [Rhizobiaceae bacterium]
MDWQLAISRNRDALLRIVAVLYALAGAANGAVVAVLPRPVYRTILSILRPAESAVRRLIIIAAFGLVVAPRLSKPFPAAFASNPAAERLPTFLLIDPLKRYSPSAALIEAADDDDIWDLDEADVPDGDYAGDGLPRISVPGHIDA